jgi:hypothetical protein
MLPVTKGSQVVRFDGGALMGTDSATLRGGAGINGATLGGGTGAAGSRGGMASPLGEMWGPSPG